MFNLLILDKTLVILIDIIGIWLGVWVYSSDRKSKVNQYFLVMIILALFWITLCYFSGILVNNLDVSLVLAKLAYGMTILFFIPFYYFSLNFVNEEHRFSYLKVLIIGFSITLFFVSLFTNFMVKNMVFVNNGVVPYLGDGKFIYFGFIFVVSLFIISRFLKKYFASLDKEKLKLQYFLVGIFIFIVVNLIFNVILAFREGIARYYQIGNYSIIFFLAFTAYATVKQNLFGIKILLTALLVSFIAVLLSMDILIFTESLVLQFFKVIGLIAFLYLGRSLIMSVLEEEKMVEKMKKLNNELAQANGSLKEMIEMKTSFLHIVSHQLRTPLTAMRGYVSMWQEGDFDDFTPRKMNEMKKRIANNTERLNNLVNEMVVAMESEGGIKLNFEKVNVEEIIKNNIEFMKANYEKKKLYIRYRKIDKNIPRIDGDAKYLANAFMNLIDNAEKYTQKGGLKIKIGREGDNIKIEFSDTGVGIKPVDRIKLFHKFARGESSSLINPNGSGLGLFIIKQIIRDHHGTIQFDSEGEGKGTTFIVTLPIKQPASTVTGGSASNSSGQSVLTSEKSNNSAVKVKA